MGSATHKRIVNNIYISRMEIFFSVFFYYRANHRGNHTDKSGDTISLCKQASFRICDTTCIVQCFVNNRAHGSLCKCIENFITYCNQRVFYDIQCDWIDFVVLSHYSTSVSTIRLPYSSTLKRCPGQTTVAVVGSSTTNGPSAFAPYPSLLRS